MAFTVKGLDEFSLSLKEMAELPESVKDNMLQAGADILIPALKRKLEALGLVDSKKLRDSIKAFRKIRYGEPVYKIYPAGKRGQRKRRAVTKTYKNSKHGRTYTVGGDTVDVTNGEVGFIHEFGAEKTRHIPAKMWMLTTVEENAAKVEAAEAAVYDEWLKSKNL